MDEPPTMWQLDTLDDLINYIHPETVDSMCEPWRELTVFDFWLQDSDKAQKLIHLFEIEISGR